MDLLKTSLWVYKRIVYIYIYIVNIYAEVYIHKEIGSIAGEISCELYRFKSPKRSAAGSAKVSCILPLFGWSVKCSE